MQHQAELGTHVNDVTALVHAHLQVAICVGMMMIVCHIQTHVAMNLQEYVKKKHVML
tara:strand:- start:184 stop:354 length:171 start_codon:yes stop_codon:yes gene_type:complete